MPRPSAAAFPWPTLPPPPVFGPTPGQRAYEAAPPHGADDPAWPDLRPEVRAEWEAMAGAAA